MNRIDRLSAILIHLQTKKIVTASEIAERFGVSLRTIYRDIKALEEAGIPIGSEAGSGYFIVPGYHLPPVMFSTKEALSMLIAEKFVDNLADKDTQTAYHSAMYKIKAVLPDSEKDFLNTISKNIEILHFKPKYDEISIQQQVQLIQKAIVEHKMIRMDYFSLYKNQQTNDRLIEPLGLCYYSFQWHLIGYCKMRNDYRDFRVDRIKQIAVSEFPFNPQRRITMQEYLQRVATDKSLTPLTLDIEKNLFEEIRNYISYYGFLNHENLQNGWVRCNFMNDSLEYVAKWLLTLGDKCRVVKPVELMYELKKLVDILNAHYLNT